LLGGAQFERGSGWVARGRRLLEADGRECVEQGYLLFAAGVMAIFQRQLAEAYATFAAAGEIGERFADADVVTLARHGQGRALIRQGRDADGEALRDARTGAVSRRGTS